MGISLTNIAVGALHADSFQSPVGALHADPFQSPVGALHADSFQSPVGTLHATSQREYLEYPIISRNIIIITKNRM